MKGNQPWPNLSFAAAEAFDLFLLLGDTVYADGAVTQAEYRAFWTAAMGTTGLQDLFASTSVIATWDDHEVGNDWSIDDEGMEEQATTALAAFKEAIPVGDGGGWAGIWRSLRWGDTLEVFVLECRAERRDGLYVSAEQLAWLERALLASTARFKLIANSVPITDFADTSLGDYFTEQRWQGHAEQRSEILSFILDNQIGGVLWLAGDFHFGLLARIDASGGPGEDAWEVLAGPSGSFLNPIVETLDDVDRFPVAFGAWNYTKFVADPGLGTIDVQWIGDDGTVIAERTLEV
jgi:alkaline phosphatase D